MSIQSSHEPESFAEASNHSCWRDAMQEEINAQEKEPFRFRRGIFLLSANASNLCR